MSPANRRLIEIAPSGHQPLDSMGAQYQDVGAPARADPNMWDTVGTEYSVWPGPPAWSRPFGTSAPAPRQTSQQKGISSECFRFATAVGPVGGFGSGRW